MDVFNTYSLNIVAWLLSKGHTIKDLKHIGNKTVFFFDKDDRCQKHLDEYHNNIELKNFISQFKKIKKMVQH